MYQKRISAGFAVQNAGVRISPQQEKRCPNGHPFSWRRRGDSNSRSRFPRTNDLANRPLQPLGYSSVCSRLRLTRNFHALLQIIAYTVAEADGSRLIIRVSRSSHLGEYRIDLATTSNSDYCNTPPGVTPILNISVRIDIVVIDML